MISASSGDRRPAVWPWLIMPLAALTLFFALRSFRQLPDPAPVDTGPETTTSSEPAGQ
jgi:hypothetical protein